jgi:hypothetical protein
MGKIIDPEIRFRKYFIKKDRKNCWIWHGSRCTDGYGNFSIMRKHISAHRFSYELHKGRFNKKLSVLHRCDEPACVNPNHLWLGTQKDNMDDCARKKRMGKSRGEKHYRSNFEETDIFEIIEIYKFMKIPDIARLYDVSIGCIAHIVKGRSWKHI